MNQSNSQSYLCCNWDRLATFFPLWINDRGINNYRFKGGKRLWSIGCVKSVVLTGSTISFYDFDCLDCDSDTKTTYHVTLDITNLSNMELCISSNHLKTRDNKIISISIISHSNIHTLNHALNLSSILHVVDITNSLLFMSWFFIDDNFLFKFHDHFCLVKDCTSKAMQNLVFNKCFSMLSSFFNFNCTTCGMNKYSRSTLCFS